MSSWDQTISGKMIVKLEAFDPFSLVYSFHVGLGE